MVECSFVYEKQKTGTFMARVKGKRSNRQTSAGGFLREVKKRRPPGGPRTRWRDYGVMKYSKYTSVRVSDRRGVQTECGMSL